MNALNTPLAELDPEVHAALRAELHRQQSTLEMIASENFAPSAVLEAQGSVEHVDVTERLAIERIVLALQPEPDIAALRARTEALAAKHPLYPHLSEAEAEAEDAVAGTGTEAGEVR